MTNVHRSVHDGDGAICEIHDLLGYRAEEMRIHAGQST